MYDQATSSHQYSTSLIFTHQYLQNGPGFVMEGTVEEAHSKNLTWFSILQGWIKGADSVQATDGKNATRSVVQGHMVRALCGALMQNGLPDTATEALYRKVQGTLTNEEMKKDISEDTQKALESMKHLGDSIWTAWDRKLDDFTSTICAGISHTWDRATVVGTGPFAIKHTVYGDPVVAFMNDFMDLGVFDGTPSMIERSTREQIGSFLGGCFRSGTKVLTRDSHVAIEDANEGLEVLTRAGDQPQYGICSDEVVYQESGTEGLKTLWGINDEVPFFTANHVFHTTTGLRAIDPAGSRSENPWIDVGTLQAGHVLLHTRDGRSYDEVPIHRLTSVATTDNRVYGLHLREGLRTYHANGFLVNLNYPEITIKSIGRALQQFSQPQRLSMLRAIHEIKPLLDRFGAHTMLDRLAVDINHASETSSMTPYAGPAVEVDICLNDLKRAWEIVYESPDNMKDAVCNNIEVYEGLFFVNGELCSLASVSGNEVHWRRRLNGRWEHGQIEFTSAFEIGHGTVNFGSYQQTMWGSHTSRVTAYASRQSTIKLLDQQKVGQLTTDPRLSHLLESSTPLVPEAQGRDQAVDTSILTAEAGVGASLAYQVADHSPLERTSALEASSVAAAVSEGMVTEEAPAKTLETAYRYIDSYMLKYDVSPWDDARTLPAKPEDLFHLTTGHDKRTGLRTARIDELDVLSNAIHARSEKAITSLPPELYRCVMVKEETLTYIVEILKPDLIAAHADGNDHEGELSLTNLTYRNLGLDITFPFLFSLLEVHPSWNAATMTGFCRSFDPTMIASCGSRHLVSGSWSATPAFPVRKTIVAAASAPISTENSSNTSSVTFLTRNKDLAASGMTAQVPLPADDIIGAQRLCQSNLDVSKLKEDTEKMLQNVMFYHMDDDTRKTWTSIAKPEIGSSSDRIPEELGPNLTTSTKDWLRKQ